MHIPLIITAVLTCVLFALLVIVRIRETAKTSFIFFTVFGVMLVGILYALRSMQSTYLICAILIAETLLLPYFIILASGISLKREKPKKKDEQQSFNISATDMHEKSLQINKDFTAKASDLLTTENGITEFLQYCAHTLMEKTHSDGCVFLIVDEFDNFLTVRTLTGNFPPPYKLPDALPHTPVHVETKFRYAQFPFTGNIFGNVVSSGMSVFMRDATKDNRVFENGKEEFLALNTFIFIPVKIQNETIGVAAISRNAGKSQFTETDFETAQTIVDAAAISVRPLINFLDYSERRNLTEEGKIASKFQKNLIPAVPDIAGISIGAWSMPCENVCGDFYDVIASRKDRVSLIFADVAGKGMNSYTVMVMIRAMLRLVVNTQQSAATILNWANRGLCMESAQQDHFASVVLINYNPLTKDAEISTSGINPVLLYSAAQQTITQISKEEEPLGVENNASYADIHVQLSTGDMLVTCSDGLLESLNESGVQYTLEGLKRIIANCHELSGEGIAAQVKEAVEKHCGDTRQHDDMSIMVIKIK